MVLEGDVGGDQEGRERVHHSSQEGRLTLPDMFTRENAVT
jgi:hypothetical protein